MTDIRRKRIVYMSDQEWADARKRAAPDSVSEFIRRAVAVEPTVATVALPYRKTISDAGAKAIRDDLVGALTKANDANDARRASFGHSSPAPKPPKR